MELLDSLGLIWASLKGALTSHTCADVNFTLTLLNMLPYNYSVVATMRSLFIPNFAHTDGTS